ncbi:hypothetical protein OHB12_08270 [Nocardia sp. NBC_01730]|uniref:hypothetical protein n=1 Tax=Nocardia sp. NBC_01730 TaxID=2975998 RepID=UPI002E12EA41|nr:hypothetical protein OHB12_08270 [Nocardia sp. NBC_01730]
MASPIDITRIRRVTAGFAFLPLTAAAVLVAPPAAADPTAWPSLGDLTSGSATGGTSVTAGADAVGTELALAPPAYAVSAATGSAVPQTVSSGSSESAGSPLALGPVRPEAGTAAVGSSDALGLESGSVQAACTGSAASGSALMTLGSATGSWWSESALGSAVVGSAVTGSALLTCLLLLPGAPLPDPYPDIPLQLGPPQPGSPMLAAPPAPSPPAPPPLPPTEPRTPAVIAGASTYQQPLALPVHNPVAWNVLQLITVMVVAVLTAACGRITHARNRS